MADTEINGTPQNQNAEKRPRRLWWRRAIKALLLIALAAILFVYGIIVATLSLLTPERLTPIVERVATSQLQNARVDIGSVELKLKSTYPFFTVDINDFTLVNTAMADARKLPGLAEPVPEYADTLLHFESFTGGVDVTALLTGKLHFSDVILAAPTANVVVVNDSVNNFDIFPPSKEEKPSEPFDFSTLPTLQISRLAIVRPGPVRYSDATTATKVTALFSDISVDGAGAPVYRLAFNGDIDSPLLMEYMTVHNLRVGLYGDIFWDQRTPYAVGLKGFAFEAGPVGGVISVHADMSDGLLVDSLDVTLNPISVAQVLDLAPESMGIPRDIKTSAIVKARMHLIEPFKAAAQVLPHCKVDLDIPDSYFAWKQVKLNNIALALTVTVPTDNLDDITVQVSRLNLRGPATDLSFKGSATNLLADPAFNVNVCGSTDLSRLPRQLLAAVPGHISGRVNADATVKGRLSMLNLQQFSKLQATGLVRLSQLHWQGPDSLGNVYAHTAVFDFGTDRNFTSAAGQQSGRTLATSLSVDSAHVATPDVQSTLGDFKIGLGVANTGYAQRGTVVPLGGGLKVGRLDILSLADSAMVHLRNTAGRAVIAPHNGNMRKPHLDFDLTIGRVMAGDRSQRFTLRDAQVDFSAWPEPQGPRARRISAIADSLHKRYPQLAHDSIDVMAARHYDHQLRARRRHNARAAVADSSEIIDLETNSTLKRVLLGWHLGGELKANRAAVFTPYFPVRNRITGLDITFNNDSVNLRQVRYKAGRSDFNLAGSITNIRRALTTSNGRQPLRIRLGLTADTINVNQLAEAAFRGSAFAAADSLTRAQVNLGNTDNEHALEKAISSSTATAPAAKSGFLIPSNIDARLELHASNIIYSDLLLHNFTGELLAYDGSLNIHNLNASSDVGRVNLSALYMGHDPANLKFGFGLKVDRFNLHRFLGLVPAVDSLMPLLRDFQGVISADIAATTNITRQMDFDLPSLDAAIKISGDSLVLLDPDTFKSLSKWLMFKDKNRNVIDQMQAQLLVRDNKMEVFPFIFNIDRYRLGVMGNNDLDMNFKYHVSVLKSPIPFKFGINISGNPDDFKVRLGGAKVKENMPVRVALVDSTRVNLIREIEDVFRRGVQQGSQRGTTDFRKVNARMNNTMGSRRRELDEAMADTVSAADSLQFIEHGLIDAPVVDQDKGKKKKKRK